MIRLKITTLFFLLFSILLTTGCVQIEPNAIEGLLDLSRQNYSGDTVTPLSGEWELYWGEFLMPERFKDLSDLPQKTGIVNMPAIWTGQKITQYRSNAKGETDFIIPTSGFATARLLLILPEIETTLSLAVPFQFSAYKLYANGTLIASNGTISKTKKGEIAQTLPLVAELPRNETRVELVLQISNFHMNRMGVPQPLLLGNSINLSARRNRALFLDLFLAGAMIIMALYHIGLFFIYDKNRSSIYFALICLLITLRVIGLGQTAIIALFPSLNFEIYIKILYAGATYSIPLLLLYLAKIFPYDINRKANHIFLFIGFPVSLLLTLLPADLASIAMKPFYIYIGCVFIYTAVVLITALIRKREGSLVTFIGIIVLLLMTTNDILFDSNLIQSIYIAPFGMFGFMLAQAFLISFRFSRTTAHAPSISEYALKKSRRNLMNKSEIREHDDPFLYDTLKTAQIFPDDGLSLIPKRQNPDSLAASTTVLFAEIRIISGVKRAANPQDVFTLFNTILDSISPIVKKYHGFIEQYIGDSIMALFPEHPVQAVHCGIGIISAVNKLNEERKARGESLVEIGIGIHYGLVKMDALENELRQGKFKEIEIPFIASKLQGLARHYGVQLIISESILSRISSYGEFYHRYLGSIMVSAERKLEIYDIFNSDPPSLFKEKMQMQKKINRAAILYKEKKYKEACDLTMELMDKHSTDSALMFLHNSIQDKLKIWESTGLDEL